MAWNCGGRVKITCLNGYFIFRETAVGGIAKFNSNFGQDLAAKDDYYTFSGIVGTPDYSLIGSPFLDLVGVVAYEGKPWELFEQNQFVYDFTVKALVPMASITRQVDFLRQPSYWLSNALVQPGSITSDWRQITGYQCTLDFRFKTFNYSEFFYA
jgi:hypothetical protein